MTLYYVDWCPECILVKQKLNALGVQYEAVRVPDARSARTQVTEVSNQSYVPVLKDGNSVLTETSDILAHLDAAYSRHE